MKIEPINENAFKCDFVQKVCTITGIATVAGAITYYVPKINLAAKSLFQYTIVADPSKLNVPIIIGGLLTYLGVVMSFASLVCMKSTEEEMAAYAGSSAINNLYFLSKLFFILGLTIAFISGSVTAFLIAVYKFS